MAERELEGMIPFRWVDLLAVTGIRVGGVLVAPLFLFVARTWRGRLIGLTAWAAIAAIAFLIAAEYALVVGELLPGPDAKPKNPAAHRFYDAVFSAALLGEIAALGWLATGVVLLIALTPTYHTAPAAGVSSVFLGPTWLHRWQMALPPEDDLLWLGAWLVSRLDPWMTRADARQLRAGVRGLLDDMAEYPEYQTLAPALGLGIWGSAFRPDHGHFFAYVPETAPGERLGLLVALHGHGGNAKLWLHVWRAFADGHRVAVVCPSFGYGNWEHPASPAAVERALNFALAHYPVDPGRVVLAGLSQGGAGVGRAAAAMPDRFAGLIFLSPTMEPDVLGSPEFIEGWKGRPVLVVQGGRDHNVKPATVTAAVEAMRRDGIDVTYHLDPDADHFLFFAKLDEMHQRIGGWLSQLPDHPGRAANRDDPRRQVLGHDASGPDHRVIADRHACQDDRPAADPDVVPDPDRGG